MFEGTAAETERLDALIENHADNWRVGRMSVIDRAILRLATYELTRTSTPPKVILDEAIELAKRFSGDEAAPFVNGVLDAIARSLGEVPDAAPAKKERAIATGIFNSGTNVGAIAGPALVAWITEAFGWRMAFIATGALGFLWIVVWLALYRRPEESRGT